VAALIAEHAPDAVALEESYVGADARIALSVGQARGAVLVACAAAEVSCVEYSPATVKQAVCGYGRAEKPQVQMMVKLLLGLAAAPSPHDAADALAVAICHLHSVPHGGLKARLDDVARATAPRTKLPRSWRQYRPPANG